jgi:thiol-disulfide isomerase/thioredoxin
MKAYILLIMAVVVLSCSKEEKKCTISGGLTGGDSKTILLFKASKFPVYEAEIPVSNGRFSYSFTFKQPEVYWLMAKEKFQRGVINEVPFVGERGKIEISMNSDNGGYDVEGHQLNKALLAYYKDLNKKFLNEAIKYRDSVAVMYRNGTVFSKDFKELQDALPKTKDPLQRSQILNAQRNLRSMGAMYNPKAKQFVKMQDSIAAAQKKWEEEYVDQNTSIPAYYLYMKNLKGLAASKNGKAVETPVLEKAKKNLERFSAQFPEHPYENIVKNTLQGLQTIYEGGNYIDFEASDAKGENKKLSGVLQNNKLILLDFWSIWSDATIKANKDLIQIYNQYKDKGLEIVGITHVYGASDDAVKLIEKENYPWTNLIDKDNSVGVWEKYNLSYQSGGTLLMDASGKIIAVDPSKDELKSKIAEVLK